MTAAGTAIGGRVEIAIVGAGIAGCALAAALAPTGLDILLLEGAELPAAPPPHAHAIDAVDPRVSALSVASTRLLQEVGAWQLLPAGVASPYEHMCVWEQDGTGRIEFAAGEIGQPLLGHILENRWAVATLLARLAAAPNVRVLGAQRLLALEAAGGSAPRTRLTLASGGSVEAALVVGADGARSAVRELCAIDARHWDTGQQAIVATVETARSHRRTAWQRFLPSGPLALLPLATLPDEHACSIVWSADEAVARELMGLPDAAFAARLAQASEQCLGGVRAVSRRFAVPLRPLHAASYCAPGVALVGDAAHVIHPLAGQGINLGLADVRVLVEEIRRALARGRAIGDAEVLARYQRRRRGENALMLRAMEGFRLLYGDERPAARLARNLGMSAVHGIGPLKREFMRRAMGLAG